VTTRTALRMAIVGLATAAFGAGFAAPSQAADAAGVRDIDWSNATLEMIKGEWRCPGGPVTFVDGVAKVDTGAARPSTYVQGSVEFGDVNRDGREDAVLKATCHPLGNTHIKVPAVYAFGVENGAPKQIGVVTTPLIYPESYSVSGGAVTVNARQVDSPEAELIPFKLRWDGKAFTERTGKEAYLYDWGSEPLALPFKAAQVPLRPRSDGQPDKPCPKTTVKFEDGGEFWRTGHYTSPDRISYGIRAHDFGDVNRDGRTDVMVELVCTDYDNMIETQSSWTYLYTVRNGKPVLLSYLTATWWLDGYTNIQDVKLTPGKVTLKQAAGTSDVMVDRTFRWTGNRLKAQNPLPGFPKVDVAP
jgi:hypothetical protein